MTNPKTALARPIDPEFAAVFEAAGEAETLPRQSDVRTTSVDSSREKKSQASSSGTNPVDDGFEALEEFERIALENQRNSIDRKTLQPGSFDQIENDISNTVKIGWDFLTR